MTFVKGYKITEEHRRKLSLSHQGKSSNMKGQHHSIETKIKISKMMKKLHKDGKGNGFQKGHQGFWDSWTKEAKEKLWKGDNVGYKGLHKWVKKCKGKPKICEHCGIDCEEKRLEWANIDHKYKRNLDDFISLCCKCHRCYDKLNN